jgi:hypothetical protein
MIRRIKLNHTPALIFEDFVSNLRSFADGSNSDENEELDLLLKYAMRNNSSEAPAPNTNRIWKRLSRRVTGPFGKLAVEGPVVSGEEMATGHGHQVPFTVGDEHSAARARNSKDAATQHIAPPPVAREAPSTI